MNGEDSRGFGLSERYGNLRQVESVVTELPSDHAEQPRQFSDNKGLSHLFGLSDFLYGLTSISKTTTAELATKNTKGTEGTGAKLGIEAVHWGDKSGSRPVT